MPGMGAPSESKRASPRAAFSVASVGMKACGIRPLTSMIPFSQPTATPVATIIATVGIPPPKSVQPKASAPVTVQSASTDPTERSIPPTRITNSWPMARQASGATWTKTFERLSPVRKKGDASVMITTSSPRISAGPTDMTRRAALTPLPVRAPERRPGLVVAVLIGAPPVGFGEPSPPL